MSWRGDIAAWTVTQLKTNISYLRDVEVINDPAEIVQILNNPPSAAILVPPGTTDDEYPDTTSQTVMYPVIIYYSAEGFTGVEEDESTTGVYQLSDDIYHALTDPDEGELAPPLPTGCFFPMRLRSGGTEEFRDGFVSEFAAYDTGINQEKE